MHRLFKKLYAPVILALVMVFYQNCAPFKATDVTKSADGALTNLVTKVSAIMATGHMGRSVVSCDGGRTWIHDRSDDDSARCWVTGDPNDVECDHNSSAGKHVDYDNGFFYASFGWGAPGTLRRSADGITWTTLLSGSYGAGSIKIGDKIFLNWGGWQLSDDAGTTWSNLPSANIPAAGDHLSLFKFDSRILTISSEGDLAVSNDVGRTWPYVTSTGTQYTNAASGNGILVAVGNTAYDPNTGANVASFSRSADGGATWTTNTLESGAWLSWSGLVFNGTQFVGWENGKRWTSTDGLSWTSTPLTSSPLWGPIIYHPATQSYVLVSSSWGNYYSSQKAYYSLDGLTWTMLDNSHFTGGHPINSIVIGDVNSTACLN